MKTIYKAFELEDVTNKIYGEGFFINSALILNNVPVSCQFSSEDIKGNSFDEAAENLSYVARKGVSYTILPVLTFD